MDVIRGVSFEVEQGNTNVLMQIFSGIDVRKYNWQSIGSQNEAWTSDRGIDVFLDCVYDGEGFLKQISEPIQIVFLKLQAYLPGSAMKNINTFEQFEDSDCQLMVLIYDCEEVEIYTKNKRELELLDKNAKVMGFRNLNYITDSNDERTSMNIR